MIKISRSIYMNKIVGFFSLLLLLISCQSIANDTVDQIEGPQLIRNAVLFLSSHPLKTFNVQYGIDSIALEDSLLAIAGPSDDIRIRNIKTGLFNYEYSKMARSIAID